MKATEQYFPVVLFIMMYKVVLTFKSVNEILWCYYSHETSPTELFSNSCSALYKQKIKFFFHCKLGLKRLMQRLSSKIITSKLKTWSLSVPKHAGSNGYPFLGPIDDQQCLAPWKGIWIPEHGTLLLVESGIGILGFGIWKTTQEIRIPKRLESGIQFFWKRLEARTWNPESPAWSPQPKPVLDFLTWGEVTQREIHNDI